MACNCTSQTYGTPTQPKNQDCLCINDVRVNCDEGPAPCGDSMTIDLTQYNDVTASPCDVEYKLLSYDETAFASVTLTEAGSLSVTTTNLFVKHAKYEIQYKVDSPCSIMSDTATVYICMEDLCKGLADCDPCEGEEDPEIGVGGDDGPEINVY